MAVLYDLVESPLGSLLVTSDEEGNLTGLHTPGRAHGADPAPGWKRDRAAVDKVVLQLGEYFAGDRREFDLTLRPQGTAFQRTVWGELRLIPYGETASYGEIAARIGMPGAARAVGHANARNPIGIIIPCHRVVASGGALGGYAGGPDAKRFLLDLEAERRSG